MFIHLEAHVSTSFLFMSEAKVLLNYGINFKAWHGPIFLF